MNVEYEGPDGHASISASAFFMSVVTGELMLRCYGNKMRAASDVETRAALDQIPGLADLVASLGEKPASPRRGRKKSKA